MPKSKNRRQKPAKSNQIVLIVGFVAVVLLLLFLRLVVFVRGGRGHSFR